jgi:hypothetical protein
MASRRQLVLAAAAATAATPALLACSSAPSPEEAAREQRREVEVGTAELAASTPSGIPALTPALTRELVRLATLAPSSHNTQCWTFRAGAGGLRIEPDLARRCPVVDPDEHHLYVSLGCAAENLVHAALAHGLAASARLGADGAVELGLKATKARRTPLFQAIAERQCTRGDYDGRPLTSEELRLLEQAGSGPGVRVILLTARPAMEQVLEFVMAANTAQIHDPAFVAELKSWIRFSADEAVRSGDGLYAAASGNPSMPRWLGSRLMDWVYTPKSENERLSRQVRNAAGLAVFVAEAADRAHWVEVGRCYERFALQATALGIRNAFLNQPVEVGALRPDFAQALGLAGQRPDLVLRFGRGPALPMSLRRPVSAVLV